MTLEEQKKNADEALLKHYEELKKKIQLVRYFTDAVVNSTKAVEAKDVDATFEDERRLGTALLKELLGRDPTYQEVNAAMG